MTITQTLINALALIEAGFTQGSFATLRPQDNQSYDSSNPCTVTDPGACCFCAVGAVLRTMNLRAAQATAQYGETAKVPGVNYLVAAAREQWPDFAKSYEREDSGFVFFVNDKLGKDAVKKMFTRAIELASKEETDVHSNVA